MNVDDVQYVGPAGTIPASRLTLQYIGHVTDPYFVAVTANNSDARQPDDVSTWPPALILDFFYGCAALIAWSPKRFGTFIKGLNFNHYYGGTKAQSGESDGEDGYNRGGTSQQTIDRSARREAREKKREGGDQEECGQDKLSEAMDMVMSLWMQHMMKCEPEQRVDHSQKEKVKAWLAQHEDETV